MTYFLLASSVTGLVIQAIIYIRRNLKEYDKKITQECKIVKYDLSK